MTGGALAIAHAAENARGARRLGAGKWRRKSVQKAAKLNRAKLLARAKFSGDRQPGEEDVRRNFIISR